MNHFLIIGLGNPGNKYLNNRHNIGFRIVDSFFDKHTFLKWDTMFNGLISTRNIVKHKITLCKPSTYMNLSGEFVHKILNFYKINFAELIVIYDDIDLPFGTIKISRNKSAGGHNGMKNIISHLGTENVNRIRVGIGRPINQRIDEYVLSDFNNEEMKLLSGITNKVIDIIEAYSASGDILETMNEFN